MNAGGKGKFGALAILAVIFTIGALFGVGGSFYYMKERRDRPDRNDRNMRDVYRVSVDRMANRLERSLELTDEQMPLVKGEIEKFAAAMREVHQSMEPRFEALMRERSTAIEQHLTEEQLETFREQRKQRREHHERIKEKREAEHGPRACSGGFKGGCPFGSSSLS